MYIRKGCGIGVEGPDLKEGIVGAVIKVCGTSRRRGEAKRTRWWNEEVKCSEKEENDV